MPVSKQELDDIIDKAGIPEKHARKLREANEGKAPSSGERRTRGSGAPGQDKTPVAQI